MEKIKAWLSLHRKEAWFGAVIFFVSSLSFGTGYLADRQFNRATITIEACSGAAEPHWAQPQ